MDSQQVGTSQVVNSSEFSPAPFEQDKTAPGGTIQEEHLDIVLDVPVNVSMEVGRTRISIRELLQLSPGSVVKLQNSVGDPMDIFVNGRLVAKGEVVVLGEQFGIRIVEVASPEERVRSLK